MKRLCVLGSLHLDVIVRATQLPQLDETVNGSGVNYISGGKGGNQALAAESHGATVYFVGRVGSDTFGQILTMTLKNRTIDISQLQKDEGASGMSVAIIDQQGDYGAVIVSEANLRIDKSHLNISEDTGILLLQNEIPDELNLAASQKASIVGSQVWLNAAPARKLSQELIKNINLLIINRPEAQFYKDLLNSPECDHIIKIFTLGEDGLDIQCPGQAKKHFTSYDVKALSTHGAGDTFIGALAAHQLRNNKILDSLNYAQAAAAIKVSRDTSDIRVITDNDVSQFLKNLDQSKF